MIYLVYDCASKQIEIDLEEISHKVAISVQPNKLKQYWGNIAQSGQKPESFLAFYPLDDDSKDSCIDG